MISAIVAEVGPVTVVASESAFRVLMRVDGHVVEESIPMDVVAEIAARTCRDLPAAACSQCNGVGVVCRGRAR